MGGLFGVASNRDCVLDLFYGIDYHSHLGTRRGGMAVHGKDGFDRAIHNIENSPFRTKFERDAESMKGNMGIGCISDYEPQPLLIQSHLGSFAIATVGKINNVNSLLKVVYSSGHAHFQEMTTGQVNATELVASLICKKNSIVEGIRYVQGIIEGSMSILILTKEGIYAARDRYGRTPLSIGRNDDGYSVSFEDFVFFSLGYAKEKDLGAGEIVYITPDSMEVVSPAKKDMKVCSFLWAYYGYPTSSYEGVNVEEMRYKCGAMLAKHDKDDIKPDLVAGVPDSGLAHAIGYANAFGISYARPFIKYTPTWSRSFTPSNQAQRSLVAKRKLIPVPSLIENKKLLLIDDSIVRGTQLGETTEFLYNSGAKEVHIRPASPPLLYGCKFLNFSRSKSEMDLITRRTIKELEGDNYTDEVLEEYADPNNPKYDAMVESICKQLNFTTLKYHRLDDLIAAIGIEPCKLCTYCFDGKE